MAEAYYVKYTTQKARKTAEAKTREKTKKQKLMEEKKKKNKWSTLSNSRMKY